MRDLLRIFRLALPYWRHILLNAFFNLLSAIFSVLSLLLVIPFLRVLFGTTAPSAEAVPFALNKESLSRWFDHLFGRIVETYGDYQTLLILCGSVILAFLVKNLFFFLALYVLAPLRTGVIRDLRNRLYSHLLILPLSFYSTRKKGDIMSRATNDIQEVEWSILRSFELFFREPVSLLFFLVTLLMMSLPLSLLAFAVLPLAALIISRLARSLRRKSGKAQAVLGTLLSSVEETISGIRIIKAFNAFKYSGARFRKHNQQLTGLLTSISRRSELSSPLSEFLGVMVLVVILWFGGRLVLQHSGGLSPEGFITYLILFSQMITPAKNLSAAWYQIQKGAASLDRIEELLDAEEVITEKPEALRIHDLREGIVFRDVSFSYESEPVLQHIDLVLPRGRVIALVGPSGAGKSTLADLLPRFYDATSGSILFDGHPIQDYRIDDIRGLMGIVSQDTILFNDSVHNNIAFGDPSYTREEVTAAARTANAEEFILRMEDGYDSLIGDRGARLSGGQRQRLSIARAVLRDPPILIFDEATSALDTLSEKLVQDAITRLTRDRTVVIIAHRLSTIRHADLIVVLDKGRIVESGSHEELMLKEGPYARLQEALRLR